MNAAERLEGALEAVVQNEIDSPAPGSTLLDVMHGVLGDIGEEPAQRLLEAMPVLYKKFREQLARPEEALLYVFLTGTKLGKQLGIGEGAELPSLSTPMPPPPKWMQPDC